MWAPSRPESLSFSAGAMTGALQFAIWQKLYVGLVSQSCDTRVEMFASACTKASS
jgi:hypothetical protein